jgi:tRNA (guanine-N7-)-methyltransferase
MTTIGDEADMARRALRKTVDAEKVAGFLLKPDQLPAAMDPQVIFGRTAPLEVEVGTGKGLFLRNAAAARPDRSFLGIEVARKYAEFVASRLARDEQTNARMVSGDAMVVFQEKLKDNSVEDVHVYFPDPWWKAKHRRRRIVNDRFLAEVERVLVPGGRFHLWTDVQEYFESSLELIARSTSLSRPMDVPEDTALHDLDYRTHFERRVRLNGLPVFRAEFSKAMWQVEIATGLGLPPASIHES